MKPNFFSGPAVSEEIKAGFVVSVDGNLMLRPFDLPQMDGNHVSDKFEVGNLKMEKFVGDGAREVLVVVVVVTTESGRTVLQSIRRGVQ